MKRYLVVFVFIISASFLAVKVSAQKQETRVNQPSQSKTFGHSIQVNFPANAKFLTYGYLLDSVKNINIPFNRVLYGPNKVYYEVDGIYVCLDAGRLLEKSSMDKVIQNADFFLTPTEPKDYEVITYNNNSVLLKYSRDQQLIRLSSVDSTGFAFINAEIFCRKGEYEKAKQEANRLVKGITFFNYKPPVHQIIRIKDLIKFDIPESAVQINYNQYVKFLKDSNHYFSVVPDLDRLKYYQFDDITVRVVATPRPKPVLFDEWVKRRTAPMERFGSDADSKPNHPWDYSIHSFAGKRVLVTRTVDPNQMSITGLSDSGDVSYTINMYFKPNTYLNALKEMERLVRTVEFKAKEK